MGIHLESSGQVSRILVVAPIRRGLLADLAGALSGHNVGLKGAHCWQTQSGSDLFSYSLDDASAKRLQDESLWQRVLKNIYKATQKELDVEAHIANRPKTWGSEGPANSGFDEVEVHIDQEISAAATVVDVRARDRVGLVYRISKTIADAGFMVQFATGTIYGDIALDTCYVVNEEGGKLTDEHAHKLAVLIDQALVAFRDEDND